MTDTSHHRATAHIINHTHWDREWFLTAEYTSQWLPELIDGVAACAAANPGYSYLLDGQTLAAEDLIALAPEYREKVDALVAAGSLSLGPLYSQPDWRLTGGETLLRNLLYGTADVADHGGKTSVAWMVDTFGHIGQAPQLLRLAGLDSVYVWRGVPLFEPVFRWVGPDGSEVTTINLFGGYRNLYGITRTPDLAVRRLVGEIDKLAPHYQGLPIPLFDGYDLETEPEDPIRHYLQVGVPDRIELVESSPLEYVQAIAGVAATAPVVSGELLSGKYGATFPGSLSARTYLKVLQGDCETLLFHYVEPLAALAGVRPGTNGDTPLPFEGWTRELLQNAVHDCICGVSIDQVHERMERSYRRMLTEMQHHGESSLATIAAGFAPGDYVVATSPIPSVGSLRVGDQLFSYRTDGIGVAPASVEPVDLNPIADVDGALAALDRPIDAPAVAVGADGTLTIGSIAVGPLVVTADHGDTYSAEPGEQLATTSSPTGFVVESTTSADVVLAADLRARWSDGWLDATLRARVTAAPTVELMLDLDTGGTGFIVEFDVATGLDGPVTAAMPFEFVQRNEADTDLLPTTLSDEMTQVLMGQREVDRVSTFPFQDHVARSDGAATAIVHARSLRSYRSDGQRLLVTVRRSVEWLARTGLELRAGDAGPAMYVPDARDERSTRHHLAVTSTAAQPGSAAFVAHCDAFAHPPLAITVDAASTGTATEWSGPTATVPITSLAPTPSGAAMRVVNLTDAPVEITTDPGDPRTVAPAEIAILPLSVEVPRGSAGDTVPAVAVHWPDQATDRAGVRRTLPDPDILASLEERAAALDTEAQELRARLDGAEGDEYHRILHQVYVAERESLELALSAHLGRRKATDPSAEVSIPDEVDPEVSALGERLNDLRIHRRIYDYVAALVS
ncbi:MAG: hypothetical protein AAF467_11365 [Actinomycetota bacterium]